LSLLPPLPGCFRIRSWSATSRHPAREARGSRGLANGKLDKEYKLVPGLEKLTVVDTLAAIQALAPALCALCGARLHGQHRRTRRAPVGLAARCGAPASLAPDTIPTTPLRRAVGHGKHQAPQAWDTTIGDPTVVVAVIDTGIDIQSSRPCRQHLDKPWRDIGQRRRRRRNGYVDDV